MISKIISKTKFEKEENCFEVELENTIFRPQGGGQPGDQGKLIKKDNSDQEFLIVNTFKKDNKIIHILKTDKQDSLNINDEVELIVNTDLKDELAKLHSAEHILFQSIKRIDEDAVVEKVNIHAQESSLFVKSPNLNIDKIIEAEKLANNIISENRNINIHEITKEEVPNYKLLRIKLEKIKDDKIRVVEIENFDQSACCGSHVKNTSEIGFLVISKINFIGKGTYEIRYKLNDLSLLFDLANPSRKARSILNVDSDQIIANITNLKTANENFKEKIRELSKLVNIEIKKEKLNNELNFWYAVFPGINKRDFIQKINEIELQLKKNTESSLNILQNFIMELSLEPNT
mgnify:FL=1